MPYIKDERRAELKVGSSPRDGGELNYLFTLLVLYGYHKPEAFEKICDDYWSLSEQRYKNINELGGAALNCALEFKRRGFHDKCREGLKALGEGYIDWYRKNAGPYEDTKILENGDVFPS